MSRRRQTFYALKSFMHFARAYKARFALVFGTFFIANILIVIIPIFVGKLVGLLASPELDREAVVIYTIILIACSTGHNLFWRLSEILHMRYINTIPHEYETLLFRAVITQPYPYFVDKFTGKISSHITTISNELKDFLKLIYYSYLASVIGVVSIGIIMMSINWQTGLIFGVGIVCMLVVGRITIRNSSRYEKIAADINSDKHGKIIDAIANFVNVKSFAKESKEITYIEEAQTKTIAATNRAYRWAIVFWGSMSFFVRDFIWPLALGVNVYLFLHGEVTIAQMATLLATILIFTNIIWEIIWEISQFNLRIARLEEAHTYLFGPTTHLPSQLTAPAAAPTFETSLELRQLSFAYPDKPDISVLKNVNLQLTKGEKIGIVGRSGGGKSTLTKLLLNYYQLPEDGEILIDSHAVSTADIASLISYVPQDTSLFHRTIAENIAYACARNPSREQIIEAARKANAVTFIEQTVHGFDSLVGERGVKLSAGQRQRIAIARAFLDDKPILILDEATSALDSESEILIQDALEKLWHDKTVIAIAHRLSTLRHMDRIIVIDQGKIVEEGSHHTLLARKGGVYRTLWNHQSGGFIEE